MKTNISDIVEVIGAAVFKYVNQKDTEGKCSNPVKDDTTKTVHTFVQLAVGGYAIVTWPDVQELMDEDWFDEEAILETEGKFGSSAYFVPIKRLI
jgi:hypothetical protein